MKLGLNLGAGTWGISSSGSPVPGGAEGSAYWYPSPDEIALAAKCGAKSVRMGAAASRVYSTPTGPLNPDFAKAVAAVKQARSLGMRVYFCFHEYGFAWGKKITVADVPACVRCFDLLAQFKGDPDFIPCSWNEPQAILDGYWSIVKAWLGAMRAAGWTQTLGVSAQNWAGFGQINEQIDQILALGDRNIMVEGHYYFDLPPEQWPSWSGRGDSTSIWNLTETDIASGRIKTVVEDNWAKAFQPSIDAARKAGLKLFLGETSLPFGPVGNAVRRLLLPKWEAASDVLVDRLLWVAAQHQTQGDPNQLFGEVDGKPVPTPLLLDEMAALVIGEPAKVDPRLALMDAVVTMSQSAMSRASLTAALVKLRDSYS